MPLMEGEEPASKLHGYLTVLGGICIHLFCGNVYLWGNIGHYVLSYFHHLGDNNATSNIAICILPISILV